MGFHAVTVDYLHDLYRKELIKEVCWGIFTGTKEYIFFVLEYLVTGMYINPQEKGAP